VVPLYLADAVGQQPWQGPQAFPVLLTLWQSGGTVLDVCSSIRGEEVREIGVLLGS